MQKNDPFPSWVSDAIQKSCNTSSFEQLLVDIHKDIKFQLKKQGVRSFASLSPYEQASLVEREFYEMQECGSSLLGNFGSDLYKAVDDKLVEVLSNQGGKTQTTNIELLTNLCSDAVFDMLKVAPPEMFTSAKLFLNRPLPIPLRPQIWSLSFSLSFSSSTSSEEFKQNFLLKLAPSLEVLFTRHCHMLLDKFFPTVSSRPTASYVKTLISNFFRAYSLPMPHNDESFKNADLIFFVLLPIIITFDKYTNIAYLQNLQNATESGKDAR